jgi:hypothetical protein
MSNPWHRLRPLPAAPLVVRRRYLIEVPSALTATPLVLRCKLLWPLRRCALRVLKRGAQADARPAVRRHALTVKKSAVKKASRDASGSRQLPVTIADNAKALGYVFARLVGSRDMHKATARTLSRLCAGLSTEQVQ